MIKLTRKNIKIIIAISSIAAISLALLLYWRYQKLYPSTDDAYLEAHIVHIAAQVSGPVSKVYVHNHQQVSAGQKLFDIDPSAFNIALNAAKAKLAQVQKKLQSQQQAINVASALVAQRRSQFNITCKNAKRIVTLAKEGHLSKQASDKAKSDVIIAKAAWHSACSQLQQAKIQRGNLGTNNADLKAAIAQLQLAKLNLQHSHITAPTSGQLVNFTLYKGTMVTANQPLFDLVYKKQWWVNANFKETQLQRIKPGQTATIKVDMYPHQQFTGNVQQLSIGSGAAFSLLPPENATGNWVKVTQRFVVKVLINHPCQALPLRVGASATVTIDTTHE